MLTEGGSPLTDPAARIHQHLGYELCQPRNQTGGVSRRPLIPNKNTPQNPLEVCHDHSLLSALAPLHVVGKGAWVAEVCRARFRRENRCPLIRAPALKQETDLP